jgi:hypothetical protein
LILILVLLGLGIWAYTFFKGLKLHRVMLPVDRHYAFRRQSASPDVEGTYQTSNAITGSRVVEGRAYLKMGNHRFRPQVDVVTCTRGQEAITYWFKDDEQWKAIDGSDAMAPLLCTTSEGIGVKVALRLRYRIIDDDFALLSIQSPGKYKHLVAGDVVTTVNDVIGYRSIYELGNLFATQGREALRLDIQSLLASKLGARSLELTDLFLGPIAFPKDVAQGFADIVKSGAYAKAAEVAAYGRALANSYIQPTLTPEVIALAQAEAPLHAAWTQWAGPNMIDAASTVRVQQLPPPMPPPAPPAPPAE